MNPDDLFPASYRGAEWLVSGSGIDGGRKDAKKSIANSDRQLIEDLGLMPRSFTLDGVIAARRNNAGSIIKPYLQARQELLAALEAGEVGVLIHPFDGRIENVACRTFSLNESMNDLGEGQITIAFEISDTDGVPVASADVLSAVAAKNDEVTRAFKAAITDAYRVTATSTGSFINQIAKLISFKNAVAQATSPIAAVSTRINEFNNLLGNFQSEITSLIVAPADLSVAIENIFSDINGLYTTADGTITAFGNLFDFGDLDIRLEKDTWDRAERQRNTDLINYSVQSSALGYSYLAAAQVSYRTVEEIEDAANRLEVQYQKLANAEDMTDKILQAVAEARTTAQLFFDDQQLVARRIISIDTNPISVRQLAFQYYGESILGQDIGDLNQFVDPTLVQGIVRVFTE